MSARLLLAATLVLVLPLTACNSRDRRTAPTTSLVSAAAGGTVLSETHDINVPATALVEDTEVTLSVAPITGYPALEFARPDVVIIDPEGTVLEVPAIVTIHSTLVAAGEGDAVSIVQLASGDGVESWVSVESSLDPSTGAVTVPVSRFAPLAIVVRPEVIAEGTRITGTILWGDGTIVSGAPVELYVGDSVLTTSTTDSEGRFSFVDLEPGLYNVVLEFECRISELVEIAAGETYDLDLVLCGG